MATKYLCESLLKIYYQTRLDGVTLDSLVKEQVNLLLHPQNIVRPRLLNLVITDPPPSVVLELLSLLFLLGYGLCPFFVLRRRQRDRCAHPRLFIARA